MKVSILVPAYNEAGNIREVLESLIGQKTHDAEIIEVLVIASGCTDATVQIAREVARGKPGVRVHADEQRRGKVAAINQYIAMRDQRAEVLVIASADISVAPDVVEAIVQTFRERPEIGMAGARAVPDNEPNGVVNRMVLALWDLHHRVALEVPKMGELVAALAELVERVSELSVVDEASIEDVIRSKGFGLAYLPLAIVRNHGPERWEEYFEQRRRIACGHYWLEFAFGYQVATLHPFLILKKTGELFFEQDAPGKLALAAAVGTEVAARLAGFIDARIVGGRRRTWIPLPSTKKLKKSAA